MLLLQCEVCGRQIFGAPVRAVIEGANMTVCTKCGKLSSGNWEPKAQPRPKKSAVYQPIQPFKKRKQITTVPETLELAENVGQLVRQARESLGISHDDLGRKTREKVSVLRKIESGKMVPDLVLAEKLEHTLKIKLRVPPAEPKTQISTSAKPHGTTLGDLIQFKMKKKGAEK
ncbi:MAG: TIGR00270 family protein [Candidatus Bathyarchaeum sp.]|nr:MAG: TIGR00270 family protein [Candidatus Bathyarchaeum sp.]